MNRLVAFVRVVQPRIQVVLDPQLLFLIILIAIRCLRHGPCEVLVDPATRVVSADGVYGGICYKSVKIAQLWL